MDGRQRRLTDSLQFKLSLWLLLTIGLVAILAGLASFTSATEEANEFQDDELRQVAAWVDGRALEAAATPQPDVSATTEPQSRIFVQRLDGSSAPGAHQHLLLPANLPDGLRTIRSGADTYRVFVRSVDGVHIAVAQAMSDRDEIAGDSALRTLLPLLALFPILILVVALLVRQAFRSMATLALQLDARAGDDLEPLASAPVPSEVRPFVAAINRLLERVRHAMIEQRRFVADAAHELRSPLTALSLQAERLALSPMSEDAHSRLQTLRQGIERGRALLDQLLTLARANTAPPAVRAAISVRQLYRRVLEDLLPLAHDKALDVGLALDEDAQVRANEADLTVLLKNLVENAIRYTPAGGRVDLSVTRAIDGIALVIEDNGPGISASERARVFDPFYRVLGGEAGGSGLGLSIVKAIAGRLGATVTLADANGTPPSGLRVTVTLPIAPE